MVVLQDEMAAEQRFTSTVIIKSDQEDNSSLDMCVDVFVYVGYGWNADRQKSSHLDDRRLLEPPHCG